MAHFAKIDQNNIVTQVIVVEQDVIDSGLFGDPTSWVQTSYNTRGGVHILGGTPLRKNFAGIGYVYDPVADEFNPPSEASVIENNDIVTIAEPVATEPILASVETVVVSAPTAIESISTLTASDTISL